MKMLDKVLGLRDQEAYEQRIQEQKRLREIEEHKSHVRAVRERQQAISDARERAEARAQEQFNAAVTRPPRPVPIPPARPPKLSWEEQERERREAQERERERSERVQAKRQADLDRQQAAVRAWAAQRDVLRAKVTDAETVMQQAQGEISCAVTAGDAEAAGRARQRLAGAEVMRDAAQAEVDRHQFLQPAVRQR